MFDKHDPESVARRSKPAPKPLSGEEAHEMLQILGRNSGERDNRRKELDDK